MKTKGVIYYSDSRIDPLFAAVVMGTIMCSHLPIVSVTLKPIAFGRNYVYKANPGYVTMLEQIRIALQYQKTDYVFFCEHDVVYNPTHFNFIPPSDDTFYYDTNVWRWKIGSENAIQHDRMIPLSMMCCNRDLAIKHYSMKLDKIKEIGVDKFTSKEPDLARKWGYEPGTKQKKRGGLADEKFDVWHSEGSSIDIRYDKTFSRPKVSKDEFKHKPTGWREKPIKEIRGGLGLEYLSYMFS